MYWKKQMLVYIFSLEMVLFWALTLICVQRQWMIRQRSLFFNLFKHSSVLKIIDKVKQKDMLSQMEDN